MVTTIDEGKGFVKSFWNELSPRIAKVEPRFAQIVNQLSPDNSFPIYLVYLPYGALKGDTQSSFIPNQEGGYYRLTDPNAPKEVINDLGYGKDSSPLGMVLDKQLEYFIDLKQQKISIPNAIYNPGTFFPLSRILGFKSKRIYAPNKLLTVTSGVRSTFLLPNIGCASNHVNLQRELNVKPSAVKNLYEQWNLFKEITASPILNCDWRSCLIYFSEKWVRYLHEDKSWLPLKIYLQEQGWRKSEYTRNHAYYDVMFSMIQQQRNLKPNPYLADTARHLFTIAMGEALGFAPAVSEDALPLNLLQKVFVDIYNLKKYFPTIIQPQYFYFEDAINPIYYSLQNPSTFLFSPKSRKISNTLFELRELNHIIEKFLEELSSPTNIFSDTILNKIAAGIDFSFYHNQVDRHGVIKPSAQIFEDDKQFTPPFASSESFASDATFVRGCVAIKKNIG